MSLCVFGGLSVLQESCLEILNKGVAYRGYTLPPPLGENSGSLPAPGPMTHKQFH